MSSINPISFPFGMVPIANTRTSSRQVVPTSRSWQMKSVFSDNSTVFYTPGTLAPGGVGTTRNSRAKAKKT